MTGTRTRTARRLFAELDTIDGERFIPQLGMADGGFAGVIEPSEGIEQLGTMALLIGDGCVDMGAIREIAMAFPDLAVFLPRSENELQAEAVLELALALSDSLAGLVIVVEADGAEPGEPGHGGSAIILFGKMLAEAMSGDDILFADIELPVRPARAARAATADADDPAAAARASRGAPARGRLPRRPLGRLFVSSSRSRLGARGRRGRIADHAPEGSTARLVHLAERGSAVGYPKVTVVGAGQVGATAAELLLLHDIADVCMIDVAEGLPQGKALDLMHAALGRAVRPERRRHERLRRHRRQRRRGRDRRPAAQARHDPRRPARRQQRDRALASSRRRVAASPDAVFVCVTNPLDIMTYLAWKESGLPAERVLGMGGVLDSARFAFAVAEKTGAPIADDRRARDGRARRRDGADAALHDRRRRRRSPSCCPPTRSRRSSSARSSAAPRSSRCSRPARRSTRRPRASSRWCARSSATPARRCRAACTSRGEYGIDDVYLSVPARLGRAGVLGVVELPLDRRANSTRCARRPRRSPRRSTPSACGRRRACALSTSATRSREAIPRAACELCAPTSLARARGCRAARALGARSRRARAARRERAHRGSATRVPLCQDTGTVWVRIELGSEETLTGNVLSRGRTPPSPRRTATAGLRMSLVRDALLDRTNTGDNTPAFVDLAWRPGHRRDRARDAQGRRLGQREPHRDALAGRRLRGRQARRARDGRREGDRCVPAAARRASGSARPSTRWAVSPSGRCCARSAPMPKDDRVARARGRAARRGQRDRHRPGGPRRRHDRARGAPGDRAVPHRRAARRGEPGLLRGPQRRRGGGRVSEPQRRRRRDRRVEPPAERSAARTARAARTAGSSRNRNFRRLWYAQFVSGIGDWLVIGFLMPLVTQALRRLLVRGRRHPDRQDHPGARILSSFTGALVDRFDRRKRDDRRRPRRARPSRSCSSCTNSLWVIYLVVLLMETASLFFWPARNALIPYLVDEDDITAANGLAYTTQQASMLIGLTAAAGILAGVRGDRARRGRRAAADRRPARRVSPHPRFSARAPA